ncbi:hypothetical protein DSCO28_04150 [Desulfosarcina ovata subsp. sediminis]|uniref:Uncharacterized protein n=1 Tax=Desulfosarcina ovata subsp. sediminis TaxID=885957 RepID=A0A5K7ZJG4_9BACT|nr:hypothetical protein DSCO28_04150 [Desulfosarcina ovata subsp. sediminis]
MGNNNMDADRLWSSKITIINIKGKVKIKCSILEVTDTTGIIGAGNRGRSISSLLLDADMTA